MRSFVDLDEARGIHKGLLDTVSLREFEDTQDAVVAVNGPGVGLRDLDRVGDDRRQHRIEVERGVDGTPGLLEHLQFTHCLGEVAGSLLDFLLQARVGFLELTGHSIEMVGEFLHLDPA